MHGRIVVRHIQRALLRLVFPPSSRQRSCASQSKMPSSQRRVRCSVGVCTGNRVGLQHLSCRHDERKFMRLFAPNDLAIPLIESNRILSHTFADVRRRSHIITFILETYSILHSCKPAEPHPTDRHRTGSRIQPSLPSKTHTIKLHHIRVHALLSQAALPFGAFLVRQTTVWRTPATHRQP